MKKTGQFSTTCKCARIENSSLWLSMIFLRRYSAQTGFHVENLARPAFQREIRDGIHVKVSLFPFFAGIYLRQGRRVMENVPVKYRLER